METSAMIIGIGIDLVEVQRMEKILASQHTHFLERVFTPEERTYCDGKPHKAQHYAARFAAKEALMKALGTGWTAGITWAEIEVRRDAMGKPYLTLHGETARAAEERGVRQIHLSLTHTNCCAAAEVLLSGNFS